MEIEKRKPGRPVVTKHATALNEQNEVEYTREPKMVKVGHFIVINTPTIKGIRINLEKVRTYAKAGSNDNIVQIAWDNGTASSYGFGSEEDAYKFLGLLDEHCL